MRVFSFQVSQVRLCRLETEGQNEFRQQEVKSYTSVLRFLLECFRRRLSASLRSWRTSSCLLSTACLSNRKHGVFDDRMRTFWDTMISKKWLHTATLIGLHSRSSWTRSTESSPNGWEWRVVNWLKASPGYIYSLVDTFVYWCKVIRQRASVSWYSRHIDIAKSFIYKDPCVRPVRSAEHMKLQEGIPGVLSHH